MKKLILGLIFVLGFITVTQGQSIWKPNNPNGLIYSDNEVTVIITDRYITANPSKTDIVLYDSIGHFILEWKDTDLIYLSEIRVKYLYDFITKEKGWIKIYRKDLPTIKMEGYLRDKDKK